MRAIAFGLAIAMLALPQNVWPQVKTDTGSIRYIFETLLVPDAGAERSITVDKYGPWVSGKAVPAKAVVLATDVPLPETGIFLRSGTVMTAATADRLIACANGVLVKAGVGGMGKSPICLVDLDQDGRLDGWFKGSINALEPWGYYEIRFSQGMLTWCIGRSDVCKQGAPKIKLTDSEHLTEFMGGVFAYRKLADGNLAVRIVRDPGEEKY